ncbi:MAG: diaminopimelate decarboxylase [bacterium]
MEASFYRSSGRLLVGGTPLGHLAERFGTPLYVYDWKTIQDRVEAVRAAFSSTDLTLCYSVKANSNRVLLRRLAGLGLGFDVVSGGELQRVLSADLSPARTVFAGVGKRTEELRMAMESDIWMITLESIQEARLLRSLAFEADHENVPVALRLNLDVDAGSHPHITTGRGADKFGILEEEREEALLEIETDTCLELVGLHMHLGSQIRSIDPYEKGIRRLIDACRAARGRGHPVRWLNAGGGFGIPYERSGEVPSPGEYASVLTRPLEEVEADLVLELGRWLTGPAGCLLTRVLYSKRRGGRNLAVCDAGMNDLLRPALYGARHRIETVGRGESEPASWDVAGPICESADYLGREVCLPSDLSPGDLLAVMDTGAYGMSMSSNYNSRLRPAEVLVEEDGGLTLMRRRETLEDLLRPERGLV